MSSFYAARSSGGHERSGATEHARPLQRLACDGNSYTEDEFAEWYGEEYRDMWDSASGITMSIPSGQGPQAGAIEHSAPATQWLVPLILEVSQLPAIRDAENAITPKRALHSLARDALNAFAAAHHDGPTCLDELFPWKAYLASHAKGEMVVGEGITRAVVDKLEDVKDPNQGGRPRTDFIFYRVDGSAYRVHPGTKPKNDSAPVYCPPSRATEQAATCVWHARPVETFTYEDACRIPQTDKLGKQQAFLALQNQPEQFMWWLFAANLGPDTADVIGSGLTSSNLVEQSDMNARLRFQRHDGSTIDVEILNCGQRGFKTRKHR